MTFIKLERRKKEEKKKKAKRKKKKFFVPSPPHYFFCFFPCFDIFFVCVYEFCYSVSLFCWFEFCGCSSFGDVVFGYYYASEAKDDACRARGGCGLEEVSSSGLAERREW